MSRSRVRGLIFLAAAAVLAAGEASASPACDEQYKATMMFSSPVRYKTLFFVILTAWGARLVITTPAPSVTEEPLDPPQVILGALRPIILPVPPCCIFEFPGLQPATWSTECE